MNRKCYFLFLLLITMGMASYAQVTTSGLTGFIRNDSAGADAATVTAVHEPSGTSYATVTEANGNFNIQGMRPGGPYKVTIEYLGTDPKVITGIYLTLGENYVLNETVGGQKSEAIEGVQIVASKNPILNSDRTGAATNINAATISSMPTISRSISDFTRLTPQANGNGFAGRDGRYNNTQIDGANFNNGFGLSSDPLPGGGNQPVSLDAIDEVQVNVAPYDVRQTGFTGAGINAVTRSGTNKFTGSVYGYLRPESFTGLNVEDQKLSKTSRTSSKILGGRIGGPIIKNKLFFFANFEYENRESAGNTWLAARPGLEGDNVTSVSSSDLDAVKAHLIEKYGYDPGAYEGYADKYVNKNIKGLLRLDWNINSKNKLSIRYNQMSGTSDQGTNANSGPNPRSGVGRISSNSIAFENANYNFKDNVASVTAELNSTINSKWSNQLLATYSHIRDTRNTPGESFPFVDIFNGSHTTKADGSDSTIIGTNNYMSFGTELFSHNNDVVNNNISVTDNISYSVNKHLFTGGISFQTMSYGNSYMREGTSYYRYNTVEDFLNDAPPIAYAITYPYPGNDGYARVKFGLAGLYIQDKISVNERLNVTLGLRADMPLFFDNPPGNPTADTLTLLDKDGNTTHYTTAKWSQSTPLFSPRVGFNYDVLGNRSFQLRGGTGIFTGNIPFVWFTNMPTNAGVIQATYEPVSTATLAQIDHFEPDPMYWPTHLPDAFPQKPSDKAPGSVNFIDPKFRMPQVWRTNLGADVRIANTPLIATVDLIYTKDINAIYQFNANRKPATAQLDNGADHRAFWNGSSNAVYNSATGSTIPVLSNTNKGYSFAGTAGLSLNNWKGLSASLFYTYSMAKDVSGNPGSAAGSAWSNNYSINDPNELLLGYSQYAVPHRIVGNVSYRIEYAKHLATTLSLFYNGANQGRFAYTYGGDINKDGVSLDLLYLPKDASEINFVDLNDKNGNLLFTASEERAAYEAFVSGQKVLNKNTGSYIERNAGLMPWMNRFDFRVMQDLFVTESKNGRRHTLQISLDILNVGNLLSKNWGLYKQLNGGSDYNYSLLNVQNVDEAGKPSFTMATTTMDGKTVLATTPFRNLFSTSSTWGMQLGLRYSF